MLKAERLFALAMCLLALAALLFSLTIPLESDFGPGPGVFPVTISALLLAAALGDLWVTSRRSAQTGDDPFFAKPEYRGNLTLFCGMVFGLAALVYALGLPGASWVFLVAAYRWFEKFGWWTSVAAATVIVLAMYWIFALWLGLNLPMGFFD